MADIDLATILADGEYLRRAGDALIGDVPSAAGVTRDVRSYGATGDGVADDLAAFQACYDAAVAAHGVMYIPTPDVAWRLTGPVLCYEPGPVVIEGDGNTSLIHMDAFPYMVFDVMAPDHTIRRLRAKGTAGRTPAAGDPDNVWRGNRAKLASTLVWSNAANTVVTDVDVETFTIGVYKTSWDPDLDDYATTPEPGCRFENIEVRDVEFGLLARSMRDPVINNIRGTYSLSPGSATPPHLVYLPDEGPSTTGLTFGSATAFDGLDSKPFQFKNVVDGVVDSLVAENCPGAVVFEDCTRLTIQSLITRNVYDLEDTNGAVMFFGFATDCVVRSAMLHTTGPGRVVYAHNDTLRCGIENFLIVTNYATAGTSTDSAAVHFQGSKNFARNGKVRCDGTPRTGYIAYSGTGHVFDNVEAENTSGGVRVRSTATACQLVDYDRGKLAATAGRAPVEVDGPLAVNHPRAPITTQIGSDRVLVFDRFQTPRYTNGVLQAASTGQLWTIDAGSWTIENGRAKCTSAGNARCRIEAGSSNVEVEVGVLMVTAGGGLIVCGDAATNHLMVWFDQATNTVTVSKRVGGTISVIGTTPFVIQVGRRYQLTVHKFADNVKVYVDGVFVVTYTLVAGDMTAFGSLTAHGLRCHSSADNRFDNFVVRSLT